MSALTQNFSLLLTAIIVLAVLLFVTMIWHLLRKSKRAKLVRREPVLGERYVIHKSRVVNEGVEDIGGGGAVVVGKQKTMSISASDEESDAEAEENLASELEQAKASFNTEAQAKTRDFSDQDQEIISMYLLADKAQPYSGYELLQSLLTAGFRYGAKNIFHWHQDHLNVESPVLFSLAQAVAPGTFDLEAMGAMTCPGLVMFMETSTGKNDQQALDEMFEIAQNLVDDLGGVLCDNKKQPITEQVIANWKQNFRN